MPQRAKRPCKHQPCPVLVDSGYCESHQRKVTERLRQEQNDDPLRRFYKNKRWESTRLVVLGRDLICQACFLTASQVVDHIIPARIYSLRYPGQPERFYDEDNLQGLCKSCHDRKTATQDSSFAGAH